MVDFAGWSMPVQYESIVAEHVATRQHIGLFDISHMGRLRFDGPDAAKFLDRLLTRAVLPMKPGAIRYGLAANANGGIRDDVLVYRLQDSSGEFFAMVVNASNREKMLAWIEEQRGDADFSLTDLTTATAMFAVQGPSAVALGDALCRPQIGPLKYYHGVCGKFGVGDSQCSATISRTGYTGEDGFELIVDAEHAVKAWSVLLEQGRQYNIRAVGLGARDTLRLEAAMPLYGHELDEDISPLEAGLRFAIQFKDREFVGSAALNAEREAGSKRVRIGIALDGRRAPREGYAVLNDAGEPIGIITSGTFSPTLDHPIAMAYIDAAAADQTTVQVDIRGRITPARVASLPFYNRPR